MSRPLWMLSHRFDPLALPLADRHYNRQRPGTPQFVPPGRCVVLLAPPADALWVTSLQRPEYARHAWPGAWVNSLFRNESPVRSSDLIRAALAATRAIWGDPPGVGCITFVDPRKTRHKRDPGRCYRRAGFQPVGQTKGGLVALQLRPDAFPAPAMAAYPLFAWSEAA